MTDSILKEGLVDRTRQIEIVKSSRHFHKKWYAETYPDVVERGLDAAEHYVTEGAEKGHNPGKFFDAAFYIAHYPDVKTSGMTPLVHYETIGAAENRVFRPARDHHQLDRADSDEAGTGAPTLRIGTRVAGGPTRGTLSKAARAASKAKNWSAAAQHWQEVLWQMAEPYAGLSEAALELGDPARAEAVLRDGMARYPDNPILLGAQCHLAMKMRRWGEVVQIWQKLEESGCAVDPTLTFAAIEGFIRIGDLAHARSLLATLREDAAGNLKLPRMDALLAEAEGDWTAAAEIWLERAALGQRLVRTNSYLYGVRALLKSQQLDRAEAQAQQLIQTFPTEIAYLKLSAEVAIARSDWAAALERWQQVEAADPAEAGAMPADWVYRIGVESARQQTAALMTAHLRATGMLSLATTIKDVDDTGALVLARQARRFYPEQVKAIVAQVLSANTRHSAAIWWIGKLLTTSQRPERFYHPLVESLLSSSRLDECMALLDRYQARYGRDTLWLRGQIEVHYRRGDFVAMQEVMLAAIQTPLPAYSKSLRVTRWIYALIRLHPTPQTFLPEELHDTIRRIAALYDSQFLSDSISMLLIPEQGDIAAQSYAAQIAATAREGREIDPVQQEAMLQFFIRRRDWDQVEALLALPAPRELNAKNVNKVWNVIRNKIDLLLGRADVLGAEAAATDFLDQLAENELYGFAMSLSTGLLFRLPLSEGVVSRLLRCADCLGFTQMAERISDWRKRYVGFDPATTLGLARRKRCFIIGNAPSIADLPLWALAGEDIFCVNRGMRALDVGLPHPKYLVIADPLVYKNHAAEIDADASSVERFFVAANCLWRKPPTLPAIALGCSGLKLSLAPFLHAPLHLHRGETVVVLAAQLAHLMGYSEIYIIGVDLDYSGPVTHFYGGGRKETERLANFRPGGSGAELVNLAFENLQKIVARDGCRIYNASPAGKLDMLERVDFHDLVGVDKPSAEALALAQSPADVSFAEVYAAEMQDHDRERAAE